MHISSLQEARDIGYQSNILAMQSYGLEFIKLKDQSNGLIDADLFSLSTELGDIPLLRNGANFYWDRATQPLGFRQVGFMQAGLPVDRYLVIREGAGFFPNNSDLSPARVGLDSIISELNAEFKETQFRAPELGGSVESEFRFFDSHQNLAFFLMLAVDLIEDLGLDATIPAIPTIERTYAGDLATRFSQSNTSGVFWGNPFIVEDTAADPSKNTGRYRRFINKQARNKQHLVLIGDSHSYGNLSVLLSHFFGEVSYFWASRASRYGGQLDEIKATMQKADITIEESSERFFIRNFGKLPEGIIDPEVAARAKAA